jgi:hypothetical protein
MAVPAMAGLTFGCDPELFVLDAEGVAVCADGLIPGTKTDPYKVPGGAVQVDGMAAEFNIDPVTTFEDFQSNCKLVMGSLKKMLPKGYTLSAVPAMEFTEKVWEESPDHAKELGCSPDFNAWTLEANPPPTPPEGSRLRTASGHIHVGWTNDIDPFNPDHIGHCVDLVKQLDWFLGTWSVTVDKDNRRRSLYGKAGAMRFKPYGVEYRVLSNFWLTTPNRMEKMWDRTQTAIHSMRDRCLPDKFPTWNNRIIRSINESNIDAKLRYEFHNPIMSIG